MSLLGLSDRILRGEASIEDHHPFRPSNELEEVADGTAFVVVVRQRRRAVHRRGAVPRRHRQRVRGRRDPRGGPGVEPRAGAHGRVHARSHRPRLRHRARSKSEGRPLRVVAHEAVQPRFDRYVRTAGYNAVINQRQFGAAGMQWPVEYRSPDVTYSDRLDLSSRRARRRAAPRPGRDRRPHVGVGAVAEDPLHGRPDHLVHAERRQPAEGAAVRGGVGGGAAGDGRRSGAELLLPGHGLPIAGAATVRMVLDRHGRAARVARGADAGAR